MSLASRVLAGLVAGSLLGLALAGRDSSFAAATLTLAGLVVGLFQKEKLIFLFLGIDTLLLIIV